MSPATLTPIAMNFKRIWANFQSFHTNSNRIIMLSSDMGACLSMGSFKGGFGDLEESWGDLGRTLQGSWRNLGGFLGRFLGLWRGSWGDLERFWKVLEGACVDLGGFSRYLGRILGQFAWILSYLGVILRDLGQILGHFGNILALSLV